MVFKLNVSSLIGLVSCFFIFCFLISSLYFSIVSYFKFRNYTALDKKLESDSLSLICILSLVILNILFLILSFIFNTYNLLNNTSLPCISSLHIIQRINI